MSKINKLRTMSDKDIQSWLKKVDAENLKPALLGLDEEIKNLIFKNMTERAVEVLNKFVDKNRNMKIEKYVINENINKLEKLLN